MYYRLPSYDNLHGDCYCGTKEEPCWGSVMAVDEFCAEDYSDCWDVLLCEGHDGYSYNPSKRPEDQNVEAKPYED